MSSGPGSIIWLLLLSPQEANSQFKTFSVYDVDPDTSN
jgi:hypothetical protein